MTLRNAIERRSTRRQVDLPCQAVAEEGFRFLGGRVIDLSPEGMQVASGAQVRVGEPVLVSFRAPNSTDWMDAEAEVARVVRGQRHRPGPLHRAALHAAVHVRPRHAGGAPAQPDAAHPRAPTAP